jgi:hypothetical protein
MSKERKTAVVITAAVSIALAVGAYLYFSGKEYVIRISESDIQRKLEEKLPLTKTYLLIFQVTLENPRVRLENGSRRVRAGLDVIFNITLDNNPKPLGGTVDVSGGIRYLAEKGQLFLTDPVVEGLAVQGIPRQHTDRANMALTKALAEFYEKHPIYTLHAADAKQAAARMILKDVAVENSELVVTLGI